MTRTPDKTLGLALGGGGSRAFVHLGVLTVLAEAGIHVDRIAGSSMGAILGAMYAFDPSAARVRERACAYFAGSKLFGMHPRPAKTDGLQARRGVLGWVLKYLRTASISNIISLRRGLLRRNPAHRAIADLVPDAQIEAAVLPLACNALDLTHGRLRTFTAGPLRPVLAAGTAVGVVFPPYQWNGTTYVDAAPVCSVPVQACRSLGADVVLAVDIRTPIPDVMPIQNGFDVISRVEMIESREINDREAAAADILLQPDVGDVFWGDFTRIDGVVSAGEAAMHARLADLQGLLA